MNKQLNRRVHFFITCILAFAIPVFPLALPPIIILLALNWIFGLNMCRLFQKNTNTIFFLLFVLLYLLYLIGLIYSDDKNEALQDLETKLALLILPIIYFSADRFQIHEVKIILKYFIYGCLFAAAICFLNATFQFFMTKYKLSQGEWAWNYGINFFLKDRLSIWLHTSYISMYFVMALATIFFNRKDEKYEYFFNKNIIALILVVFVFLFASKLGIVSLLILGVIITWKFIFFERKPLWILGGVLISGFFFLSLYFFAPEFRLKIDGTFRTLTENVDVKNNKESTASRIATWKMSMEIVGSNYLYGVGTGDLKEELSIKYANNNMLFAYNSNLNSHNQYLETFATIGCSGILLLLISLLFPFVNSLRNSFFIYSFFLLLIMINFFVESMLETQAGVVFYAFFNSLFLFSKKEKHDTIFST